MRDKEAAGRIIDPVGLFKKALNKATEAIEAFKPAPSACIEAFQADARTVTLPRSPTVIITSPPYHGAVEYYRRHMLEMYWLGFTSSHKERLALRDRYIGHLRVGTGQVNEIDLNSLPSLIRTWNARMSRDSSARARGFLHYVESMRAFFSNGAKIMTDGGTIVMVVGDSRWQGRTIPTGRLLQALSAPWFQLVERRRYPLRNRYMSYSRHNGASISQETILVFRKIAAGSHA